MSIYLYHLCCKILSLCSLFPLRFSLLDVFFFLKFASSLTAAIFFPGDWHMPINPVYSPTQTWIRSISRWWGAVIRFLHSSLFQLPSFLSSLGLFPLFHFFQFHSFLPCFFELVSLFIMVLPSIFLYFLASSCLPFSYWFNFLIACFWPACS